MNNKTKILSVLLVIVSFSDLSVVDASIFDRIMQKVEKAKETVTAAKDKVLSAKDKVLAMKDKAMSAKDKIAEMKDKVMSAKEKVVEMKDKVLSEKDKVVKETKDNFSELSSNAKDAMSKVKEIAGKTQKSNDKVSEISEQPSVSEVKENDKTADITGSAGEAKEKLENNSEHSESTDVAKNTQDEPTTTAQQQGETKLVSSENSETNETNKTDVSDKEEATFSEEVIAKVDKLIPAKDVIAQLKIISFDEQAITDEDIPYLVERLKKLASEGIKKVSLSFRKSSLSLNGAMQILEGLKTYPQFVGGLTFSGNALGDEGAVSIASNLSNFPMLKYLFFSDMGITGDGAVAILSMIGKMSKNGEGTSIQLIDLSNNQISDEHLDPLVKCWNEVKDNGEMTLMLQGNSFKNTVSLDIPSNVKLVLK